MKRTVVAKDECAAAEPEAKRTKTEEANDAETVLELDEHQFECVVCFDLLVDPVVGKCGHDFCKVCLDDWARKQHTHGRTTCPVCRKDIGLSRPIHYGAPQDELGVCIRLKDLVERLFPRRSKQRRNEVEQEERVRKQRHAEELGERRTAEAAHAANMQHMLRGLRRQQQQQQQQHTMFLNHRHLNSLQQQLHQDNSLLQRAATELDLFMLLAQAQQQQQRQQQQELGPGIRCSSSCAA
ncbi:hypothetical protein OEZ85_008932 [Tetradesmus obliquus]|uniref:RING-type domain-containing protein n=1 Tax=Tetradesmus obliquus TaxID=3088 RepID=A0ABY8TKM4_TETOB|nr:hypothetical protein OEZ85_008932 [Tetradesmus obliquus]